MTPINKVFIFSCVGKDVPEATGRAQAEINRLLAGINEKSNNLQWELHSCDTILTQVINNHHDLSTGFDVKTVYEYWMTCTVTFKMAKQNS